jgi:Icc protein
MIRKILYAGWILLLVSCQTPENRGRLKEETPEFSFAFLTDIHLEREGRGLEGFQEAIKKVNELNPDFVITGGDLIMDALGVSYERADSLYDLYVETEKQFDMPVYNSMGNHEVYGLYRESGSDTTHEEYGKKMFERRIGERYYSFNHKGWHFIILDAIGMTPERNYIGQIDEAQIEWIRQDLAGLDPDTPIVISVHIPFITTYTQLTRGAMAASGAGTVITNGREVLELFLPYNLKLVLQGHLHFLEDMFVDNKVHFITGGAVSGRWWQGPPSKNVEEGFLLVKAGMDQINWEYVDYGWEAVLEE